MKNPTYPNSNELLKEAGKQPYEEDVIRFEAERNEAMDAYFNARPQLLRTREFECLFEAGFRMAWERQGKEHYSTTTGYA